MSFLHVCISTIFCFLGLVSSFTFHPWMNGGSFRRPTTEEKVLITNMTNWIQNETIRFYVQSHLLFCPGQDMCFGNHFKRNYSFELLYRSCTHCNCDHTCIRTNSCCPWRFYQQSKDTTPSYIVYMNHNEQTYSKYRAVSLQCIQPHVNDHSKQTSLRSYYMITKCHSHYNNPTVIQKCEEYFKEENVSSYQPYFSAESNETFRNFECAICNGEPPDKLIPWSLTLVCSKRESLFQTNSLSKLQSIVFKGNSFCNVVYFPTVNTPAKSCVDEKRYISTCNKTGHWSTFDDAIFSTCQSNFVDVYLECSAAFGRILYKNIYCAMCNVPDWRDHLMTECVSSYSIYDWTNSQNLVSFSALIDIKKYDQYRMESQSEGKGCSGNFLYEPRINECIPIGCAEGMQMKNSECSPIYPFISQNSYEISLLFYPTSTQRLPLNDFLEGLFRFLKNFISTHNLEKYVCSIAVLSPSLENLDDNSYFAASIRLSVNLWHNFTELVLYLNDELDKINGSIIYGFVVRHIGQSMSIYIGDKGSLSQRYQNPMTRDILIRRFSWDILQTDKDKILICYSEQSVAATTVIAASSFCKRLVIDKRKFHVVISDFKLYFVDFDFYVDSQYFWESNDRTRVEVCLDQYQTARDESRKVPEIDTEEKYLSLVCAILSSMGCLAYLIVYIFFPQSPSIPNYNMIVLSLALLLANIVYSVSRLARPYPILCLVIGGSIQFLWLGVLNLMCMSCFSIFRTFTSWNIKKSDRLLCVQLLINIAYSFIVPAFMTAVNVFVSRYFYEDDNFGYSLTTCFIARQNLNLFTFSIPIAVMITLNNFMFFIIAKEIRIKKNTSFSTTKERHTLKIYCKLSTLTGSAWILGYLNQIFHWQILSYLHIIFTGCQGVFLFFSFGLPLLLKSISGINRTTKK